MSSSTAIDLQQQHPVTATKTGSRRIFAAQFKLQVLNSYRNDSDCKGNQRATARKYGIHRRQIQKWLQCEANLRSSVVLNGGGKTATASAATTTNGNINNNSNNNNNQSASMSVNKALSLTRPNKSSINGIGGGSMDQGLMKSATAVTPATAMVELMLRQRNATTSALAAHKILQSNGQNGHDTTTTTQTVDLAHIKVEHTAAFNAASSVIYSQASAVPSVESCLRGTSAFGLPLAATAAAAASYHQSQLYGLTPVLDGYRYGPSPYVGYLPPPFKTELQEPVRPSPIYLWTGNRDDTTPSSAAATSMLGNHILSPIDLSKCAGVSSTMERQAAQQHWNWTRLHSDAASVNHSIPISTAADNKSESEITSAHRASLPNPSTIAAKPYFWEIKTEPLTDDVGAKDTATTTTADEKPWDLSSTNSRKRHYVHETEDEGISLSHETSHTVPHKVAKLFRPYASDDEDIDIDVDVDQHDDDEPAKKYLASDRQREPIIWSNHPNYSQPFQSSYWMSHGSPVSGYDSGSSTLSAYSDDGHLNDAICTGARSCSSTATSLSIGSQKGDLLRITTSSPPPQHHHTAYSDGEESATVANSTVASNTSSSRPTNYRRQILQRWSAHEEHDTASPPLAV